MAIPVKEHAKLRVEDEVDYMLNRLLFARQIDDVKNVRDDCLFLPHQMGPMWMNVDRLSDDISFFTPDQINHPETVWPVSVGVTWTKYDENGPYVECNYYESVPAKKLRGKYRFVSKYNIGYFHGRTIENMQFLSAVEYASWTGHKWQSSQRLRLNESFINGVKGAGMAPVARYVDKGENDLGTHCALGQSAALTYRYEWGAQFSVNGSARVIIPTTPQGVLELFNDRDKPQDRDRRAALRHWVSSHLRRTKRKDFSAVRAHLRGNTKFNWRGFDVEIIPSKFDQELAL